MLEGERKQPEGVEVLVRLGFSGEGVRWRALVVHRKSGERREFTSVLALLRYLERLCRESGATTPGLR